MNLRQISTLFIVYTTISVSCGFSGGRHYSSPDIDSHYYCGRKLARVLATICGDGAEKRSESGTMYNTIINPYNKDLEPQLAWPWMPTHKAQSLFTSRGKRYIVSECCEKACHLDELLAYC